MNLLKFDFFDALSAIATLLGAYSAWKSYKTSKRIEKMQELKLDVVVKDIAYEKVPDTHWHSITLQVTNLSTVASLIKKMSIQLHGKKYSLYLNNSPSLPPFTPTEVCCNLGSTGTDVLDGRYSADLTIETDRKTIVYSLNETDFMRVFHHVPESEKQTY